MFLLVIQTLSHGVAFFALLGDAQTPPIGVTWQQLAAAAAAISTLGIVLFSGIWPGAPNRKLSKIDTIIALVINAAILVLLVVGWFAGAGTGG
ncbi:MAG: hypothetical protein IAE81_22475 [Caldilineaceae bacterium]|nr:hypothetical protein [Caldilineaceae bacterium]